jgi:glycerophosphoryl diester phosphodiesterase
VAVIAHRGASAAAPKNTLAAFRLAIEQGADYVELDVQESADGEVLVAHDSDLMNVAGVPMEIWNTPAATLRSVDIGSHAARSSPASGCHARRGARAVQRQGTRHRRAEVLRPQPASRGEGRRDRRGRRDGERLHLHVARPHHGLEDEAPAASLAGGRAGRQGDRGPQEAQRRLLAVEARMASPASCGAPTAPARRLRVTVNDPAWMLSAMIRGADGLITDRPDLARQVVARRAELSDAERVAVALLIRVGARTELLAAEDFLQP